jgi:hypothetical protein
MDLLRRLQKQQLTEINEAFIARIAREQEQRTVARKKAQQAKAMKKGTKQ